MRLLLVGDIELNVWTGDMLDIRKVRILKSIDVTEKIDHAIRTFL